MESRYYQIQLASNLLQSSNLVVGLSGEVLAFKVEVHTGVGVVALLLIPCEGEAVGEDGAGGPVSSDNLRANEVSKYELAAVIHN